MRTSFIFWIIFLLLPSVSFCWIPETVDLYKDKQIEPSLRPKEIFKLFHDERKPAAKASDKSQNVTKPFGEEEDIFKFRQEHMNKILE